MLQNQEFDQAGSGQAQYEKKRDRFDLESDYNEIHLDLLSFSVKRQCRTRPVTFLSFLLGQVLYHILQKTEDNNQHNLIEKPASRFGVTSLSVKKRHRSN